jgi:large conductance mechanosensitive channel
MIKEFRDFLKRGNVIDLAVAVVVGTAFTAVVDSLVNDILMPIIGLIIGGIDFSNLIFQFGDIVITYGNFIQALVNFILIAFALFIVIRAYNKIQKKHEDQEVTPAPSAEERLLSEIRDLLKAK